MLDESVDCTICNHLNLKGEWLVEVLKMESETGQPQAQAVVQRGRTQDESGGYVAATHLQDCLLQLLVFQLTHSPTSLLQQVNSTSYYFKYTGLLLFYPDYQIYLKNNYKYNIIPFKRHDELNSICVGNYC